MNPQQILETMSDEELAVVQSTLPHEFERRGLAIESAVTALTTDSPILEDQKFSVRFDIDEQYARAIRALADLGLARSNGNLPPTLDAIFHSIPPVALEWLKERAEAGISDELVIAPSPSQLSLEQLIRRFDRKQHVNTYIWKELWNKYSEKQHSQGAKGWQVAIVLNDTRDPKDDKQPVNKCGEAGLVYTGLGFMAQKKALKKEARKAVRQGLLLESITISQLMVLNALRRGVGAKQLDERTFTRLIHYEPYAIGGFDWVPAVNFLRNRLRLFGSETAQEWSRFGVRRVLRIEVTDKSNAT